MCVIMRENASDVRNASYFLFLRAFFSCSVRHRPDHSPFLYVVRVDVAGIFTTTPVRLFCTSCTRSIVALSAPSSLSHTHISLFLTFYVEMNFDVVFCFLVGLLPVKFFRVDLPLIVLPSCPRHFHYNIINGSLILIHTKQSVAIRGGRRKARKEIKKRGGS